MMGFDQRLVEEGVMLGGDGLKPTRPGARVKFAGAARRPWSMGPFTEAKEVLCGWWIIEAEDLAAAIERAQIEQMEAQKRCG